ncbi:MAG: hypothetical protein P1V35_00635 [Planctomycetota bacterium]|nr:hypothetical protein [Planctomycetota bacterium]
MLALLLPLALAAPQSVDHSVLHPADSLVYFEMADVQGTYRAYESTAYGKVLKDEACRDALEKLLREEPGAFENPGLVLGGKLDMLTDGYWSKLKPILGEVTAVSFSASLHGATAADLFKGYEEDGFWGDNTFWNRVEGALRIQVIVDLTDEQRAAMGFAALGEAVAMAPEGSGIVTGNGSYQGRPVARIFAPKVPDTNLPAGVIQDGNRIIFVLGADPIVHMEMGHKRTDQVTSADRFHEGQKKFVDTSSGVTVFQFKSRIAEEFYSVCPEKEYIQPVVDLVVSGLGPDFDMLLRGGDWRVQLRDGLFVTESFQKDLNLGEFDRLFSGQPLNADAMDYVHEDAVIASGLSVDSKVLVGLLKNIFKDVGEDPFAEWRQKYNFRPEEDLLAHLGSTWVSSLPLDSIGVTSLPGLSLWVDLNDRPAFMSGMEKFVDVVNGEAGNELVARGKTYRKHRLFTFKGKDVSGPEAMLQPTVVVFEDRILVAVSRSRAQKEIKRTLAAPDEVTRHSHFNSSALAEGFVTVDYSYADWAKFLGRLYMGAKGFLPMLTGGMSESDAAEIPVDLNELPIAADFTRFFEPAVRYRRRVDGGTVMHSQSSFGPEMSGVIAGSMFVGLFWAMPSAVVYETQGELAPVPVEEPMEEAQGDSTEGPK